MTTVAEVIAVIEQRFPPELAEDWDAVGLAVGDPSRAVTRVHFAVDPTFDVAQEAIAAGAQLLVTHHPLMLRGVTSVAATTSKGAVAQALIEAGVAQFAAHTNADAGLGGVADALAAAIGVTVEGPLVPAQPGSSVGTGRIGAISIMTLSEFAATIAAALPSTQAGVLFAGPADARVTRVALVGGAGDTYIPDAISAGADVYVTADLRHHPVLEARETARLGDGRPYFVNVSHAASEWLWLESCADAVAQATGVAVYVSTLNTDPWTGRAGGITS